MNTATPPLGVHRDGDTITAAVYAPDADSIALCLFDEQDQETHRLRLPARTGPVFSGSFAGLSSGPRYGLRAYGPWDPAAGHRFNPAKLLLDPWATAIDRPFTLHPLLVDGTTPRPEDTAALMPKGLIASQTLPPSAVTDFDWDRQVIYELHVRGFTMTHPEIPPEIRGTYAALGHPASIRHLKRLGVTTVEVMPSAAWIDERHLPPLGLTDYWGYNPVGYLAPDPRLAPGGWAEIRGAVDALHEAGFSVVLDVVFNHSGESDEQGPTLSLRGLGNAAYYRLQPGNRALYVNDAGCGNILAMDQPGPLRLCLDALRIWALQGGFDGFRLDLAATLARRASGFDPLAPFLLAVEQDPVLSQRVFIAEPWDIGPGGYQLGGFPARWGEWNDRYRDDVRRFWRGDRGFLGAFTSRFAGSADIFAPPRPLTRSVNYIIAHDGFPLADLLAYAHKHNDANGEQNRDGTDESFSWNNGAEGASSDAAIREARATDARALLATLLLSRGTPMLSMGDELGRSQGGNNNAYAQDNPASWIAWDQADDALIGWTAELIALRRELAVLFGGTPLADPDRPDGASPTVSWHRADGALLQGEDWHGEQQTLIAAMTAADLHVALVFHAGRDPAALDLPALPSGRHWQPLLPADASVTLLPPRSVRVFRDVASAPRAGGPNGASSGGPEPRGRSSGIPDADLDRLAQRAGIAPSWWDVEGGYHPVSPDSKRALLAAMRLPAETAADFAASLRRLEQEQAAPLPPVLTARASQRLVIPLGRPAPHWVTLLREDGSQERLRPDGNHLVLPPQPIGRHRLLVEDQAEAVCHLIIAPTACHLPAALAAGERQFGIAAHLYALRSRHDQGIGDFTTLTHLAVEASASGAVLVGLNPLHALFPHDRSRTSPYQPSDRRFLDPIYVDVAGLPGGAAPERDPVRMTRQGRGKPGYGSGSQTGPSGYAPVDYANVWDGKRRVLQGLAAPSRPVPDSLLRFATFNAIAEALGHSAWRTWPAELRHPRDPGVARFAASHAAEVAFHIAAQDLAEIQLAHAATIAAGHGIGFYRDLAVGAAPDGAESWAAQDTLMHGVSIGAPPDPFSAQGQIWSLPPPDPIAMRRDGYAAFDELLASNMRHAAALRIDHVMGLRRLFIVPDGASGADGAYITYPLDDLLAVTALRSQQARCLVVGEDLGTVPEGMADALAANDILSYSVLWFERRQDGSLRPPAEWRRLAAACVSTHDLPTIAGWWIAADVAEKQQLALLDADAAEAAYAARLQEKAELVALLHAEGLLQNEADLSGTLPEAVAVAVHALVAETPALLALVQADDLAGEVQAINLPGTDRERPNWQRRLAPDVAALLQAPLSRAILGAVAARRPASSRPVPSEPVPGAVVPGALVPGGSAPAS